MQKYSKCFYVNDEPEGKVLKTRDNTNKKQ